MSTDRLTVHTLDAVDIELDLAGLGSRTYAFVIDWHIRIAAALAWFLLADLIADGLGMVGLEWEQFLSARFLLVFWPAALLYALYHPILEIWQRGRTPGKRIAGIRIVDAKGAVPGAGALLMRNVFRLVDSLPVFYGVGILCMLVTRRQLRVGDLAAGTLLIHDQDSGGVPVAATASGPFSMRQKDLAGELLARWEELETESRYALARQLLAASNTPNVKELAETLQDDELLPRIGQLMGDHPDDMWREKT